MLERRPQLREGEKEGGATALGSGWCWQFVWATSGRFSGLCACATCWAAFCLGPHLVPGHWESTGSALGADPGSGITRTAPGGGWRPATGEATHRPTDARQRSLLHRREPRGSQAPAPSAGTSPPLPRSSRGRISAFRAALPGAEGESRRVGHIFPTSVSFFWLLDLPVSDALRLKINLTLLLRLCQVWGFLFVLTVSFYKTWLGFKCKRILSS